MAKKSNQKSKLLELAKIFQQETDESHPITGKQIIEKLKEKGIPVDRKTLYTDLEELRESGMEIYIDSKGRYSTYHLANREFELAEIKLLVDSVQSAKFITEKKSKELIKKLEGLVSVHQAKELKRQVIISGRVKSMNESIYYNVDGLHEAIHARKQIRFQYLQWNLKRRLELRRKGKYYVVSPFCLMMDNDRYYLVAYDAESAKIKHYRVDKMKHIGLVDAPLEGEKDFAKFDLAQYSRSLFGMFGGERERVTLRCKNDKVGVILDRFGKRVMLSFPDAESFRVRVEVSLSSQFFAWVFAVGEGIEIEGPSHVLAMAKDEVERLYRTYHGEIKA